MDVMNTSYQTYTCHMTISMEDFSHSASLLGRDEANYNLRHRFNILFLGKIFLGLDFYVRFCHMY